MRVYPRRKCYNHIIIGEAPTRKGDSEFFIFHVFDKSSQHEGYCGAFSTKGQDDNHFFFLPAQYGETGFSATRLKRGTHLINFWRDYHNEVSKKNFRGAPAHARLRRGCTALLTTRARGQTAAEVRYPQACGGRWGLDL